MEPTGAISVTEGGEWSSFSGVSVNEEADFMAQLFPNYSFTDKLDGGSCSRVASTGWDGHDSLVNMGAVVEHSIYSSDSANSNKNSFSQDNNFSGCSAVIYATSGPENFNMSDPRHYFADDNNSAPIDFGLVNAKNTNFIEVFPDRMEGDECLNEDMINGNRNEPALDLTEAAFAPKQLQLGAEGETFEMGLTKEDDNLVSSDAPRKRSRIPYVKKGKRVVNSKKKQKLTGSCEEEHDGMLNRQSSSCYNSEDDLTTLQELEDGDVSSLTSKGTPAPNPNGKTRASRGSATDPQSLYARRRRERINERLRILQKLVPNGTKVDLSTMLEEAVQYVKFLQLQIKLLSSDDLWMYAPIAYNGMDIGLDLVVNMPR